MPIALKRIHDEPSAGDGYRVLVDGLWPRGLTKDAAGIDRWMKEVAPSADLRRWFGHDPARWGAFRSRYAEELSDRPDLVEELRTLGRSGRLTLLYAARDETRNNAVALREILDAGG